MLKFPCALTVDNKIVYAEDLRKEENIGFREFLTPDTKQPLIAKIGKVRVPHFALKSGIQHSGSKETYLHFTAKHVILDSYLTAITDKSGFFIPYQREFQCASGHKHGFSCNKTCQTEWIDLSPTFNSIELEQTEGVFIPDLLLRGDGTDRKAFIEIKVTHACSAEKIASGTHIIEISVEDLEDLNKIKSLGSRNFPLELVHIYNAKELKTGYADFCGIQEGIDLQVFSVHRNGYCSLKEVHCDEYIGMHQSVKYLYLKHFDKKTKGWWEYKNRLHFCVIEANKQFPNKLKSCYVCKHSSVVREGISHVKCWKNNTFGYSSMAIDCGEFDPKLSD
jgi:hypothetical protein